MNFVILFEDDPSVAPEIRQRNMPAHLAFLEKHAGQVKAAGPLHALDGEPAGGIWIVDAESADAAEHLVKQDPFWPTGLRKSYRILAWTRVFADGTRLIHP